MQAPSLQEIPLTNRRDFLSFAALAAPAAGLAAAPATAAPTLPLGRAAFQACVGETFHFRQSTFASAGVKLAEVGGVGEGASRVSSDRAFSLRFETPEGTAIGQGSYRVTHPRLGEIVLFVAPVGAGGRSLEAVFNLA
jgi:hypothetical protein